MTTTTIHEFSAIIRYDDINGCANAYELCYTRYKDDYNATPQQWAQFASRNARERKGTIEWLHWTWQHREYDAPSLGPDFDDDDIPF